MERSSRDARKKQGGFLPLILLSNLVRGGNELGFEVDLIRVCFQELI